VRWKFDFHASEVLKNGPSPAPRRARHLELDPAQRPHASDIDSVIKNGVIYPANKLARGRK
jgi:hypothetical protein